MGGRKERNRRCCLPSSSVASAAAPLRSDSWNAPDIKWFVQSHIGGRGRGRRRRRPSEVEVYQGTHLVGIIASSSLPFLCWCLCVRLPSPFETLKASEGVYRRCTCTGSACGVFHVFLREGNDRAAAASLNSGTVSPCGPVCGEWAASAKTRDSLGMSALRCVTSARGDSDDGDGTGSGGRDVRRGRTRNELDFPFLSCRRRRRRLLGTIQTIFPLVPSLILPFLRSSFLLSCLMSR